MYIRLRKSNLSLERAVYTPAEKDSEGKIIVHPVRTTEYVGSMHAYTTFANVPRDLMAKLDEAEKAELKAALKDNEPKTDMWLTNLPRHLQWAAKDLTLCAELVTSPDSRKVLEAQVKAAESEWNAFFKVAQGLGLKRKVNRPKKSETAAEVKTVQKQVST